MHPTTAPVQGGPDLSPDGDALITFGAWLMEQAGTYDPAEAARWLDTVLEDAQRGEEAGAERAGYDGLDALEAELLAAGIQRPRRVGDFTPLHSSSHREAQRRRPDLSGAALDAEARRLDYLFMVKKSGAARAAELVQELAALPWAPESRRGQRQAARRAAPRLRRVQRARSRAPRRAARTVARAPDVPPAPEEPAPSPRDGRSPSGVLS